MGPLTAISKAFNSPKYAARYINRQYFSFVHGEEYYQRGTAILEEDWDNLIILDGCRYDTFKAHTKYCESLQYRYSRGTSTFEFLVSNFANQTLNDTVYVTANPQFYRQRGTLNTEFNACIDIWKTDGWDENYKTVLPETTTKYALSAAKKHPHKKLIIHYIQPHYPFIGSNTTFDKKQLHSADNNRKAFWNELLTGDIDIDTEEIRTLYAENLSITLPYVHQLVDELEGKIVITSDHGNIIGERAFPIPIREWGHPPGIYVEELTKVPWLEIQNGDRKIIQEGKNVKLDHDIDDTVVNERLRDLGYTT